jgi:hypothetical protein
MSIQSKYFIRPPSWYYQEEIETYFLKVELNGMTCMPNFIQIRPVVLELNHVVGFVCCVHFLHLAKNLQ